MSDKQQIEKGPNIVVVQKWEESEAGWGCRPDGFSIHLTEEDRKAFVDRYWEGMPDHIPHEYSRPCGTPYEALVSDAVIQQIKDSKGALGLIFSQRYAYPGSGGTDGWIPSGDMVKA